jgi:PEP-CTERM motif-containing protein
MAPRLAPAALSLTLLACAAGAASATVIEYTDPTAFGSVTSNATTFTFDGLTPPGTVSLGAVTVGGLSISGSSANLPLVVGSGSPFYGGNAFFTSLSPDPGVDAAEVLCTLAGATALGFVYGDFADGGALPFTVTLSSGDTFTLTTPANPGLDTGFVGFVSDTLITSVTFSNDGVGFDLLQVETASGSSVGAPEPATLALMATGMLCLAVLGRRRMAHPGSRR